jgi:hypothetical protein
MDGSPVDEPEGSFEAQPDRPALSEEGGPARRAICRTLSAAASLVEVIVVCVAACVAYVTRDLFVGLRRLDEGVADVHCCADRRLRLARSRCCCGDGQVEAPRGRFR